MIYASEKCEARANYLIIKPPNFIQVLASIQNVGKTGRFLLPEIQQQTKTESNERTAHTHARTYTFLYIVPRWKVRSAGNFGARRPYLERF
jgi:hypothetical protein